MENSAAIWELGRTSRPHAGRRRSTAKSFKERPGRNHDNGFLRHTFRPVWIYEGEQAVMEREFFNSLSNLCRYYDIIKPTVTGVPFLQNIYQSWQKVLGGLETRDNGLTCLIITEGRKQAVLAVAKPYAIGNDLYYIPVRAFWNWATCAEHQPISELVLVIFAYLHQVVGIPFYQENGSFMDNQYETLYQWLMEAGEDDDEESKAYREHQEDTLYELRQAGAHILRLVQGEYWLGQMGKIISGYVPKNAPEREWSDLANEFLKLYTDYPNATIFDHTRPDLIYPDEEDRITPDQYTGFYWSAKDCFADELDEMISCTFQEIAVVDEPVAVLLFDEMPDKQTCYFNFEARLFALIDQLRNLLIDYDHEERYGTI